MKRIDINPCFAVFNNKHLAIRGKQFLLSVVILLFSSFSFSQVLSLDSVLIQIEKNNPALLSYENKINAKNELVSGVRTLPPLKTGIEFDDNPYDFNYGNNIIRFSVSQDFPNRKRLDAKENYLKSIALIEKHDGENLKNQLIFQAKEKYYERFIAERKINIMEQNIKILRMMIEISEKQMAILSDGELAPVYNLKAKLANAEVMLIHEQNMVKSLTLELNYLMNKDLSQHFLLDTNNLVKDYRHKAVAKDSLEYLRSDILRMNNMINTMKLNQTLTSTLSKPEFGVRARHFLKLGDADMFSIEAMVTIPIVPWHAKGYKSEIKSMGFEIDAMMMDKQAMINMANKMVNMLLIELNAEYIELENYDKKVIPAYKKSFDASNLSYSQNTGNLMMTLMALEDLQMAQMEYLRHLGTLLKIQAEYEREMQIY